MYHKKKTISQKKTHPNLKSIKFSAFPTSAKTNLTDLSLLSFYFEWCVLRLTSNSASTAVTRKKINEGNLHCLWRQCLLAHPFSRKTRTLPPRISPRLPSHSPIVHWRWTRTIVYFCTLQLSKNKIKFMFYCYFSGFFPLKPTSLLKVYLEENKTEAKFFLVR